jgi:hypothetical protein
MKRYILNTSMFLMSFATLSQNSKGFQWIQSHGDYFSASIEAVRDIQVDRAGNVYVAGEVNDQWVRDSNGVIIKSIRFFPFDSISNHGGRDIWLAKYDPQGNLLWHRYAGSGNDDRYDGMVADQNGNCYVAGRLSDHNTRPANSFGKVPVNYLNLGPFIAKVSPSGTLLWHKSFGGDTIGNFLREYLVDVYELSLTGNTLTDFLLGGGDYPAGYQRLFGKDSLENSIHEINFDQNGNYQGFKSFPFPREDKLPLVLSIKKNKHGAFISGVLNQDTVLVGNDTILKNGLDNAVVFPLIQT